VAAQEPQTYWTSTSRSAADTNDFLSRLLRAWKRTIVGDALRLVTKASNARGRLQAVRCFGLRLFQKRRAKAGSLCKSLTKGKFGRSIPTLKSRVRKLACAEAVASEKLEIYELSEIISEVSGDSARCYHTLYLLYHGRSLFLLNVAKKCFRALVEVQRFQSAMERALL
jgi:hypothetical protein